MSEGTAKPPKIRTFVGVDLADALRPPLADLLTRLQKGTQFTGAHPTWVKPDSLHLTLKFLGDVDEPMRQEVIRALRPVARRHAPHEAHLKGLGVFPSPRAPRVLWLGVKRAEPLLALQASVEEALVDIGFEPEDRRFSPHLTLARLKSLKRSQAFMDIIGSHQNWEIGDWPIREFVLYQSTLHPSGSIYTPLERFALTASVPPPGTR